MRAAAALLEALALLAALPLARLLLSLARHPQQHERAFYHAGGARRLLQVVCTDLLGSRGLELLLTLALLVYLATLPARRPALARWLALVRRPALARWLAARRLTWPAGLLLAGLLVALLAVRQSARSPLAGPPLAGPPLAAPPGSAAERRPSVLVLVADSLRADRLTATTAPRVTAWARHAVRFERAVASTPGTEPAWATLLTGRDPHHHGVRDDRSPGDAPGDRQASGQAPLTSLTSLLDDPWLPRFARAGYATALVESPTDDETARRALTAIEAAGERPFVVVVRLTTTRAPHAAPEPFYRTFTDPAYRGRFKYQRVATAAGPPLDEADRTQLRALYDGAVTAVDAAVGQILDGLAHRGREDSTVVVVTAAHGESLADETPTGEWPLDEGSLAVPLLVRDPRTPGPRTVAGLARPVDLAPTLHELTGVAPADDLDGRSLAAALTGSMLSPDVSFAESSRVWPPDPAPSQPALARRAWARQRSIRTADRTLWLTPTRHGLSGVLCDPASDPACQRDLTTTEPAAAARLRAALLDWARHDPTIEPLGEHLVPRPRVRELVGEPPARLALRPPAAATPPTAATPPPTAPPALTQRVESLLDRLDEAHRVAPAGLADAWNHQMLTGCSSPVPHLRSGAVWPGAIRRVALPHAGDVAPGQTSAVDVREALLTVPPTRVTRALTVPAGATLEVAPAAVGAVVEPVSFEVAARPRGGDRRLLARWTIAPTEANRWHEHTVDLGAFAGQPIELELSSGVDAAAVAPAAATPLALWGAPVLRSPADPELPYNVVYLLGGAPPVDDALASRGVTFDDVTAAAAGERSETLALLAGARASQLGLGPSLGELPATTRASFHAAAPPLLPVLLRPFGLRLHALVPDARLTGLARSGFDAGFVSLAQHRSPTGLVAAACDWLERHRDERFLLFVQLPPGAHREAIVDRIERLGLADRTLLVATADPWLASPEPAIGLERLAHGPLQLALPGALPAGIRRRVAVQTIDVVPTILQLEGLSAPAAVTGQSLVDWAWQEPSADPDRVLVTEGRASRRARVGRWSLIERDDPGASPVDTGSQLPDRVAAQLRERLGQELLRSTSADVARSAALAATRPGPGVAGSTALIAVRFAGAGRARRFTLAARLPEPEPGAAPPRLRARVVQGDPAALRLEGLSLDLTLVTTASELVGLEIEVEPATTPIHWEIQLDDRPLPAGLVFAGPDGLAWETLSAGLLDARARWLATSSSAAIVDPALDLGVFVTRAPTPDTGREPAGHASCIEPGTEAR